MDIATLPTERLEAELVAHAAWETAGLARMLKVLAEFDRREGWAQWGCNSAQFWLSWKCGIGYVAATERLRVAYALERFPIIDAAFTGGLLSWSKVRELTRVATPTTEQGLVDIAMATTAQQFARLTGTIRRLTPAQSTKQLQDRGLSWETDGDGSVTITVRLPADRAMPAIAVIQAAATPVKGVPATHARADAFVDLVTGAVDVSRVETFVHVDATGARFDNGPVISEEIAECLACDGPVTTLADTPNGPVVLDTRRGPTKTQRRWLGLRHRTCQFPGCHHAGKFDAHHVIEHAKGGRTNVSNLARLCWFHHRIVHLQRLQLTLHKNRTLDVKFPAGNPVDRDIPTETFYVDPPPDPNKVAGTWYGERLNLNDCFIGLGIMPTIPGDYETTDRCWDRL